MKNFDEWWAEHRGFILARIEDWSPKQMMRTAYDAGRCSYRCPHYMDAERYRWLRDGGNDNIGVVTGFDCVDVGPTGVTGTYREGLEAEQLDKAIDVAMGNRNDRT